MAQGSVFDEDRNISDRMASIREWELEHITNNPPIFMPDPRLVQIDHHWGYAPPGKLRRLIFRVVLGWKWVGAPE